MTFLRRRDCGQDRSPTIEGAAETFVALKPRATSSGYGDLIELAATAASGTKGAKMKDRLGRWHISQFAGRRTCLAGILMAGWDKEAPMSAGWTKRGRGHRGGVVRSC
jgi:hypothetical protein